MIIVFKFAEVLVSKIL